jgi:hypothetical protein
MHRGLWTGHDSLGTLSPRPSSPPHASCFSRPAIRSVPRASALAFPTSETRPVSVQSPDVSEATLRCSRCGADHADPDGCTTTRFRCVICGTPVCGQEPPGTHSALCELHDSIPVIQGWAQVYTSSDEIEAGLISQNLQSEGIDSQLYTQKDDNFPVDLGELSILRVLVPAFEFEPAIDVIRSHMDQSGEVNFACPNCGEAYEPGATVCASCGQAL